MLNALIFDIEIKRAVPGKEPRVEGVEYCNGWGDKANMGVACVCAYDYVEERYRVFMDDNLQEFFNLIGSRDVLVGHNIIAFDNEVLKHTGWTISPEVCYDTLVELWAAAGLGPVFQGASHGGFGLDAVCKANFGVGKTGYGGTAPIDFQMGKYGSLLDYCLTDVHRTKLLFDRILELGFVLDPRDPARILKMRKP